MALNRHDIEQFRRVLVPRMAEDGTGHSMDQNQKVREDFYDALTEFGMCLKLALSSRTFFEDGAFAETVIQSYKHDLRFFTELRVQAKRDAQETVDFTEYEDQIRRMVDKQVIGQQIVDPEGYIRVDTLGQSDDPADRFADHPRAQSYFGSLLDHLNGADHSEDALVAEAMHIDATVDNAVQTHSINPGSIEAETRKALLPRYFKFLGGLDAANGLIDQIVTIVRAGSAKR